jgi:hypothetical protein
MYAPAKTPMNEEHIRAKLEPRKTVIKEFDFADSSMVASCVLSPSSAIKTRKKVYITVFNILVLLISNVYSLLERCIL